MAIREKLIGILILTAAVPFLLGAVIFLVFGQTRYATERGEGFHGQARLVESGILSGLYHVVTHVDSWAFHDKLDLHCKAASNRQHWPEGLRGDIEGIEEGWPQLRAQDPELDWLFGNAVSASGHRLLKSFPLIVEVLITDREGRLIGATGKSSDYFQADEAWWQQGFALGRQEALLAEIGYDDSARVVSIDLIFPVYPEDETVTTPIGVYKVVLDASPLIASLAVDLEENVRTEIVMGDGKVLAELGKQENAPLSWNVSPATLESIQAGADSFVLEEASGKKLFGATTVDWSGNTAGKIRLPEELKIHVLVSDDYQQVMQPVREQIRTFSIAALLITLGFLALGTLLAHRSIVAPLRKLRGAARNITWAPQGEGRDQDAKRQLISEELRSIQTSDEVGDLAVDLQSMADRVFDYETNLHEQVEKMTAELRRSEEISRLVVETATDGIITIDAQGTVASYNPGAERIFGWSAEEVTGKNVKMLMPSPYRDEHDTYLKSYRETGVRKIIGKGREVVGKRKDGTEFPMYLAVGEGVLDGIPMYTGVIRDNTSLHQAQEAMEKSNQLLELQNTLKSRLATLEDSLRGERDTVRLGNTVLTRLASELGVQAGSFYALEDEETLFRQVSAYAGNLNPDLCYAPGDGLVGQVAKNGKILQVDNVPEDYLTIRSGLGETVPNELLILPITVEDKVNGVMELATTGTFSSEDLSFLETAVRNIGIHLEGTRSHRQMSRLLERTQEQAVALEDSRKELEAANESLQDQKSMIEASKERIERQAEEVEQASRYKSEFLANMSHELRTPLNSLLILAKMLGENKQGNLSDKQVTYADTIYRSGSDLLDLINDILDLSKVEAGRLEFHMEETSIDGLLGDLHRQFQHVADEKHLTFNLEREEPVPDIIYTDAKRLQQILKNLLSNAFKFTREGGIHLQVRRPRDIEIKGLEEGGGLVAFSVADTGIGIPEDKQEDVFEAFKQADGSTSRNYGGTGLGLSITREFSQRLGGRVHVESQPGKGSQFTVVIAEGSPAAPGEAPQPAVEQAPAARQRVREKPLVLVVEDDLNFSGILTELAREKGFDCLHGDNGRTGLEMARAHLPDAILLDIQMPVMSGYQVKEALDKDPATKNIPVHFLSVMEPTEELRRIGYAGYLTKPVAAEKLEDLFNRIGKALDTPRRLLVVEDDPIQQMHLKMELEQYGVVIQLCDTATGALALLKEETVDAIILDMGLAKGETGFDLLDELEKLPDFNVPPVIIYTAKDLDKGELDRLHAFTQHIVQKSGSDRSELLSKVESFLGGMQAPSAPPAVETKAPPAPAAAAPAAPKPSPPPAKAPAPKPPITSGGLEGLTVLLVDDDMRNVFALSAILEEEGMDVTVARNGLEALEALEENPELGIVLMDIMMPEMDGYEATKKIREQDRFAGLPVIALTAKAMKGDREKCLEAGASAYLSKPVDTELLLENMRELTGSSAG